MRPHKRPSTPSITTIAFASLIGTAIEFYDFYIYAMAAALVLGQVFFPASDPAVQSLNALLTFGLAFVARPVGAILFGHFGDRLGRTRTLAVSMWVMGVSTLAIGLLPGYASLGLWAPVLLCVLRFLQGVGLGGEWAGAALLATEYAPIDRRGWYGMFPQLGPSVGFLLATLTFLGLSLTVSQASFLAWAWRLPFIASALLVAVGWYVRHQLADTPTFHQVQLEKRVQAWPMRAVLMQYRGRIALGALAMAVCYHLFYTATVFGLSYGTQSLQFARPQMLGMLCVAITGMALATPLAGYLADSWGGRRVMMVGGLLAVALGFGLAPMLAEANMVRVTLFLWLALVLMGVTFAPMGAFLPSQFPVAMRYTGAGLSYQLGGIIGASLAPSVAQWLLQTGGLRWVGGYMSVMATLSVLALWAMQDAPPDKPL